MNGNDIIARLVTDNIGGHTENRGAWTALLFGEHRVAEWSWSYESGLA